MYYYWLDVTKGIGIILVILAHCIFQCNWLIDYSHMPLCYIIAGITYNPNALYNFIISKTNRIFVPYCFFAVISAIISYFPHGFGGVLTDLYGFFKTFLSL